MNGRVFAACVALSQLVIGLPKCIPYIDSGMIDLGSQDGSSPVVSAVPCANTGEAHVRIQSSAFNTVCGCAEAAGRTCTIPRGTKVIWVFADSEEHNVSSARDPAGTFGMSADRLTGSFEHTFDDAGTYRYGCTIHPAVMSGYSIVVR